LLQIPHDAIESLPGLGAVATFFQFYRPAQFIRLDAGDALPQLTALLTLLARRTGAAGGPLPFSEHHQIVFSLGGVVLLLVRELLHRGLPYDPFTQPQRLVGRFAELVERHYREEGKVEFYANRLRVTADHLSAVLRKTQQDGAKEFIQHRRFREAMLLLETSSLSIKEIAFAIGFEDADYFGRAFRKFQGVPPEAYRREARMVNREKE
jgi:AraC-like DNA-binding protein